MESVVHQAFRHIHFLDPVRLELTQVEDQFVRHAAIHPCIQTG